MLATGSSAAAQLMAAADAILGAITSLRATRQDRKSTDLHDNKKPSCIIADDWMLART